MGGEVFWGASRLRLLLPVPFLGSVGYLSVANRSLPPADLTAVLILLTLGMLQVGIVRLEVCAQGMQVGAGPWAAPRRWIPWDDVAEVTRVRVGWVLGGSARGVGLYSVRPGPALQVTWSSGRRLTVTVGRPDDALRAMQDVEDQALFPSSGGAP